MKIKVLLVAPGIEVQKVKIPASTKFIKSFFRNDLTKLNISENIALFVNRNPNIFFLQPDEWSCMFDPCPDCT